MTKRVAVLLGSIAVSAVLVFACDASDEEAGTPKKPTPTTDATVASDVTADAPISVDGLCARAGGPSAAANISNDIFAKAGADCRIGAYFTKLAAQTQTHVKDCMRIYLQEVFACPGVTYGGSKSSVGRDCRGLTNAHDGLEGPEGQKRLNKADFAAYKEVMVAALKGGKLTDEDVAKVMGVIIARENEVAPATVTDFNTNCTCSGGTVPSTGKSCIPDGGYIIPVDASNDTGQADADNDTGATQDASDDGG